ncbi:hypothetical protein [Caulobacter segnis]|uniref:Uncharacterized protein n=1 Tax=Caulobacter segnis TaxID=88688 RepID=A0A2W5WRC5_9CAUL|nr:hypothetical protein [Caulobacter segnis]PZR30424.1 MAG: hypothetical protein DI526_22570 [Caulobacter segnis]
MRKFGAACVFVLSIIAAPGAQAFCAYKGVLDAKTSVAQEFSDAQLVVRARVLSASDHLSDEDESWTEYRLEVLRAYKGRPPASLRFFTFRNSGGFYLDLPGLALPAAHDIGGEYLLFLNPAEDPDAVAEGWPVAAKGSYVVNYSCGVSAPWREVSPASRKQLLKLSGQVR